MAITDLKFASGDFIGEDIAGLSDRPADDGLTAAQLKARFDNIGKNMVALGNFNDLIDALQDDTDGDSGADNIAVTTITGAAGTTVQGVLETIAADNFVTTAKIADGQVTLQKMAANSVDSDQYVDGSIDTAHYAAGSVDATALASDAVTTAKILNANVTNEKLANLARGSIKVGGADNLVTDLNAKTSGAILVGDGTDLKSLFMIGDATFASTGAVTIANKAVTLAKMNDMATASLLGRKTAGTGVPEVLSKSDALTLLNVEDGANAYVHPTTNGNKHIPADGAANQFLKYASAGTAQWAAHGLVGSDLPLTGYSEAATNAQIASTDTVNEAFGKIQKQSNDLDTRVDATELQNATQQLELNDIERLVALMNPNQSTRVDITDAGQVVSLPKTAGIGPAKPTIKGLTATNLITNGDFSNGITGWETSGTANLSVAANVLSVTSNNTSDQPALFNVGGYSFSIGDKVFYYAKLRVTNSVCNRVLGYYYTTGLNTVFDQLTPTENQWYALSGIFTVTSATTTGLAIKTYYNDKDTANDKVMEVDGSNGNGIRVINLTATFASIGSAADYIKTFPRYFDGTQSAIAPRLRCVNEDETETSTLYTEPLTLHRVPNGTADTIELVDGVWNHVKRVSDWYTLVEGDISIATRLGTTTRVFITTDTKLINNGLSVNTIPPEYILQGYTAINMGGDAANVLVGQCSYDQGLRRLYIHLNGDYATSAAAAAALVSNPIIYQLATPIYTPISSSGVLQSYPSGTIYAEHALADAGLYTTSISVVNTDFPIDSLESLYIVDPTTGVLTELDESTAVVAVDGLSFTHAGLTSGDIVFFTYFYEFFGVWGENTYSHFDGTMVIADTANSKFYKWKIASTNGTASIVLTEVT